MSTHSVLHGLYVESLNIRRCSKFIYCFALGLNHAYNFEGRARSKVKAVFHINLKDFNRAYIINFKSQSIKSVSKLEIRGNKECLKLAASLTLKNIRKIRI